MKCDKESMRLYAVTDNAWVTGEKTLLMQVEEALKGGATCIQLREKELNDDAFLEKALAVKAICKTYGVPLIINDNVNVAIQCGADGIHVGQKDMSAGHVRKLAGEDMILGVSVQTAEQALLAEKEGADYLGVGAVFSTSTKLDADTVSHQTLHAICDVVVIPVVAIGGIYEHNIMSLSGTGIDGVALVSAIFASEDILNTCKRLLALSEQMVKASPMTHGLSGTKIDGAIFDLDGTLVDSMFIWDTIGGDYLRSLGIQPHDDLNQTFKSMSLLQAAKYYRDEYGVTQSLDEIMRGVNTMIEDYYFHDVKLKDGVRDLLELFSRDNVKMCVATATDRHLAEAALERNGIAEYFSEILTCTEVGSGKDTPEIYSRALAQLGTSKLSTIVFEDALYAVRTAKQAGFLVVGVYDSSEEVQSEEIKKLSDIYISSFTEMENYID